MRGRLTHARVRRARCFRQARRAPRHRTRADDRTFADRAPRDHHGSGTHLRTRANRDVAAEDRSGRYMRAGGEVAIVLDHRARVHDRVRADTHARLHDCTCADEAAVGERGARRNNRMWVDDRCGEPPREARCPTRAQRGIADREHDARAAVDFFVDGVFACWCIWVAKPRRAVEDSIIWCGTC